MASFLIATNNSVESGQIAFNRLNSSSGVVNPRLEYISPMVNPSSLKFFKQMNGLETSHVVGSKIDEYIYESSKYNCAEKAF